MWKLALRGHGPLKVLCPRGILGAHPVSFKVSLRNAVGSGDGDPDSGTELVGLLPAC